MKFKLVERKCFLRANDKDGEYTLSVSDFVSPPLPERAKLVSLTSTTLGKKSCGVEQSFGDMDPIYGLFLVPQETSEVKAPSTPEIRLEVIIDCSGNMGRANIDSVRHALLALGTSEFPLGPADLLGITLAKDKPHRARMMTPVGHEMALGLSLAGVMNELDTYGIADINRSILHTVDRLNTVSEKTLKGHIMIITNDETIVWKSADAQIVKAAGLSLSVIYLGKQAPETYREFVAATGGQLWVNVDHETIRSTLQADILRIKWHPMTADPDTSDCSGVTRSEVISHHAV
jgi:hypothetical protein